MGISNPCTVSPEQACGISLMGSSSDRPSPNRVRTINLALQGDGAHGAFTWGVLDRLLEEKDLGFEGLSATSAGAMNAAVFACGLAVDGREGARKALGRLLEARQRCGHPGPAATGCWV